ncbi:hypothetical protein SDC9_146891 [bioreactor metagenome]|uniref:Uncharacterized protein n=1 Tax=bioreactor metagenome TaxID=1076179 RepID=A0A645ECJ5_9ZZZZ
MPGGGISPLSGRASIAFVWTSATADAPPNASLRAEARTHFRNGETHEGYDIQHSDRI